MNTPETETAANQATGGQPKGARMPHVRAQRAPVASKKVKSGKRATPAKKAPKAAKKTEGARDGSKTAKVLELLERPDGVTLAALMKATGWQAHSVRGFLSGAIGKKMGLTVASAKGEDGERIYSVKA